MAQGSGFGQLFQSASQALGIVGNSPMRGILSQLGLGDQGGMGSQLTDQVSGETDEQRRKRMRDQQQGGLGGGQASLDLFGGMGGLQY